jgi:hypothetical protein
MRGRIDLMNVEFKTLIGLSFAAACFYARLEFAMATLRKDVKEGLARVKDDGERQLSGIRNDVNNIGAIVRRNDTKHERRNKQVLSALLDAHSKEPGSVKRFSSVLRDDSWGD